MIIWGRARYLTALQDATHRGVPWPGSYELYKLASKRFNQHRSNARERIPPIDFDLTFEQWWGIWDRSGKWEQRGCRKGQYVMARYNDTGPYALGNVYITTHEANILVRKSSLKQREASSQRLRSPEERKAQSEKLKLQLKDPVFIKANKEGLRQYRLRLKITPTNEGESS